LQAVVSVVNQSSRRNAADLTSSKAGGEMIKVGRTLEDNWNSKK
jgi:hypothetical protein